jgi:dinuclear metal center YbgI/SA1388 family protein
MLIKDFNHFIIQSFTQEKLDLVEGKDEYGFTHIGVEQISKLGYCTNLTVESAREAANQKVDLLMTHHDAWEWMAGMKAEALEILKANQISHFFIHTPLDDAEFGNNTTLLRKLGFEVIDKFADDEGMYCGRIGEISEPIAFEELVRRIEALLEEPVRAWKNHDRLIHKIGIVTGAGFSAIDLKTASDMGCDVYFTGEKILYTVQYARFCKMDLVVGSHTFTEIFGLETLSAMINDMYPSVEVVRINEEHIE